MKTRTILLSLKKYGGDSRSLYVFRVMCFVKPKIIVESSCLQIFDKEIIYGVIFRFFP